MIIAKAVIPDQYWILREHDRKVGNIETDQGEYVISLNGERTRFKTLNMIKDRVPINFESTDSPSREPDPFQVHGYPTTSLAYNAIFDVKHQLPLWTQDQRSRSWLAAGWYRVRQHRDWQVMQCPKLILLERYPYQGPFRTREEAQAS